MTEPIAQTMAGCVVLVTGERRSAELGAALERRGAVIRHAPALSMVAHEDDAQLVAATREVIAAPPDVVVVTTGVGFRGWMEAADAAGLQERLTEVLRGARIVARGPKARGAIQAAGLQADWVAESETSVEIAEALLDDGVEGLTIAVQHHGAGADGLDEAFRAAGARVCSLVVYRWGPPPDPVALDASVRAVAAGEIDAVVFTAAPGTAAWLAAADAAGVGEAVIERLRAGTTVAAAVGPTTAGPLLARGVEPLIPDRGRLGSLVRALVGHYGGLPTLATAAGPLRLHAGAAVLDGRVLALSPTALAVLRLLAERRGSVVSPVQLLAVLPGGSSDPHAAEVAVGRLRRAAGNRELIRTVVKRGYRLDVREPDVAADARPGAVPDAEPTAVEPPPVLVGCSHGTDSLSGRAAIASILDDVRRLRPDLDVREAFVDVQTPEVADVVAGGLADAGAAVVVPLLLSAGFHVHVDIAQAVVRTGSAASGALGPDPRLVAILVDRLRAAGAGPGDAIVLAAAGSSDARAADAVEEVARELQSAWPHGPVTVGYGAGAQPSVPDAVGRARADRASALPGGGARAGRVVIASYLLAPGFFHDRLLAAGADAVTAPLAPDERLAPLVLDRYGEGVATVAASRDAVPGAHVPDTVAETVAVPVAVGQVAADR